MFNRLWMLALVLSQIFPLTFFILLRVSGEEPEIRKRLGMLMADCLYMLELIYSWIFPLSLGGPG